MQVVFLAGGIASGKSTVARALEAKGAHRLDLDQLSREATQAPRVLASLAEAFGADVVDGRTGTLRRDVLAQRAFSSAERTRTLEHIVHPVVRELLAARLAEQDEDAVCVVEVPLLDRVEDLLPLANEVLCVTCPVALRRERAIRRGMDGVDFDARVRQQPSDDYLVAHATTVLQNDADEDALRSLVDAWWNGRDTEI